MKPQAINESSYQNVKYEENGLTFTEIIRQDYTGNNCVISAGFVEGENKREVDINYIRLEKNNVEPTVLLLPPDEVQALAWVSSGVIWSHLIGMMNNEKEG